MGSGNSQDSENSPKVVIRTNSANTTLTINAAHDTVNHYGNVGKVDAQKIGMDCYNEYGTAAYVKVTEGKVVAKAGGRIVVAFAANNNKDAVAVIKEPNGTIEKGLTVIEPVSTTNEARTNGIPLEYSIDSETAANPQFNYDMALAAQEATVNTIAQTAIADLIDEEAADTVVRAATNESTDYYSFKEFAQKVNAGDFDEEDNITFTLMANVDLKNEEWTPIGTKDHPFKWVFDGNGYSIKNYKILNNCENHALFGNVRGDAAVLGGSHAALDSYWTDDSKSFNYSSFEDVGSYKAVIKNLTVENAQISESAYKAAAAVICSAQHAYFQNINVRKSTIVGYKGAGGIAGSIGDCVINNCHVDEETTIYASEYHGAGIAALNNNSSIYENVLLANVILHCTNDADVSSSKGNIGGIIGSAQNGSVAVIDCVNNGDITITGNGQNYISGLVGGGNADYHQYLIDSVNNGHISGTTSKYLSGVISHCAVKAVNVINNGNVTGTPNLGMAGIGAGSIPWSEYIGCVNNGVLTNNKPNGTTFDINDDASVHVVSGEFANTSALNEYLNSLPEVKNFKLECTVVDNTGTLVIPNNVTAISSVNKVCSKVQLSENRTDSILIQIPNINYEYDAGHVIWFNTSNSNIVVPENVTVPRLSITGENTVVTIRGNVTKGVTLKNIARVDNYGTIGYINFGASSENITFNNYGTVTGVDGGSNHSVCTVSKVNLTINNHGTIKAGEGNYALLFYGNSTVVFNAYADSALIKAANLGAIVINNGPSAHAKSVTFNIQSGAAGITSGAYYGARPFTASTYECKLVINFDANLQ